MSKVVVGKEEVHLDETALDFTPENINEFLTKYAALHRYYQNKHNEAVYIARTLNDQYTVLFNSKFKENKIANNFSDKMAEASAKSDEEVVRLLDKVRKAEYVKDEIYGFLRSMDYAHDNAKELCYNMRKELDKIYPRHVMANDSGQERYKMEEKLKDLYKEKESTDG